MSIVVAFWTAKDDRGRFPNWHKWRVGGWYLWGCWRFHSTAIWRKRINQGYFSEFKDWFHNARPSTGLTAIRCEDPFHRVILLFWKDQKSTPSVPSQRQEKIVGAAFEIFPPSSPTLVPVEITQSIQNPCYFLFAESDGYSNITPIFTDSDSIKFFSITDDVKRLIFNKNKSTGMCW